MSRVINVLELARNVRKRNFVEPVPVDEGMFLANAVCDLVAVVRDILAECPVAEFTEVDCLCETCEPIRKALANLGIP